MDATQLAALKAEITGDPATIGYAGKSHDKIADLINKSQRTVNRDTFTGGLLASCLDFGEFSALTAAQKAWLQMLCSAVGELTLAKSLKDDIKDVLKAAPKSLAKLNNSTTRNGSRGEEIGLGNVTASDVADALRS